MSSSSCFPEGRRIAPRLGSLETAKKIFSGNLPLSPYLRGGHALLTPLEERCAALDSQRESHGEFPATALVVASGQAANMLLLSTLLRPRDHLIASFRLFGGTYGLLQDLFSREWECPITWFDPAETHDLSPLFRPNTKAIFVESVSNPDGIVADLDRLSEVSQRHGVPLVVDNTLGFGIAHPLRHGASLVSVSLTKHANGDNSLVAGAIIDGGTFPWEKTDRFPALTHRPPGVQASCVEAYGSSRAFCAAARKRSILYGPTLGLEQAESLLQSLDTLPERWERHLENTRIVTDFLKSHPNVAWVRSPGRDEDRENTSRAEKYFPKGAGSLILFGLKGGEEAVSQAIDRCRLIAHRAHLGQKETLLIAPDQTTHRQLSPHHKEKMRIGPETLRLSVGIEPASALCSELAHSLGET